MGANQSSTTFNEKDLPSLEERLAQPEHPLRDWVVETPLVPGSGRFMKTYRIRQTSASSDTANKNTSNSSSTTSASSSSSVVAVLKTGWVLAPPAGNETAAAASPAAASSSGDPTTASSTDETASSEPTTSLQQQSQQQQPTMEQLLQTRAAELKRLRAAVAGQTHVAPFLAWFSTQHAHQQQRSLLQQAVPIVGAVYLLRPHFYTTLADRLASRPFLSTTEKIFLASQLLQAVAALHDAGVVHGFVTTTNVAVTATGWLVLTDLAHAVKDTGVHLPDDDPSDFIYYFARQDKSASSSTSASTTAAGGGGGGGQRCYLAPERFGRRQTDSGGAASTTSGDDSLPAAVDNDESNNKTATMMGLPQSPSSSFRLTPAMDIFSVGCVLTELFLNGETCLELGDLLEYRASTKFSATLQQKLQKMERSAVRAACKHMLQLHPAKRLSAAEYWQRWNETEPFPASFALLTELVEKVTCGGNTWSSSSSSPWGDGDGSSTSPAITQSADARLAWACQVYGKVLWETVGVRDKVGQDYFERVLGFPSQQQQVNKGGDGGGPRDAQQQLQQQTSANDDDLFAETEALLAQLESLQVDGSDATSGSTADHKPNVAAPPKSSITSPPPPQTQQEERSVDCQNSLLIYLQVITATVRHVQRPASKLVALQLLQRLANKYNSTGLADHARLQRIVPVTISLLQDQDSTVRAWAVKVLTDTLSQVQQFSPSDSQIFPQYIFKRVAPLLSDPSLVARLAFCQCIASLAETAQRFLDIRHAVRLHEAVGTATSSKKKQDDRDEIFGDDVHKLLDTVSSCSSRVSLTEEEAGAAGGGGGNNNDQDNNSAAAADTAAAGGAGAGGASRSNNNNNSTLISSTYNTELASLHETVSRWVVHLTTDQSNHASFFKRAVLQDLSRLCAFFGPAGVMANILPQILAFLNERHDWELRAALLEQLSAVCSMMGRAATEEFVLPCVEVGLVDSQEFVIRRALQCLAELVQLRLLSRFAILGNTTSTATTTTTSTSTTDTHNTTTTKGTTTTATDSSSSSSLVSKYGVLLLHPSEDIRSGAIQAFTAMCQAVGPLDCQVYLIPQLAPLFRYQPAARSLMTRQGMAQCLDFPWSRDKLNRELEWVMMAASSSSSSMIHHHHQSPQQQTTHGAMGWTSIGISVTDGAIKKKQNNAADAIQSARDGSKERGGKDSDNRRMMDDPQVERFRKYLSMLLKHTASSSSSDRPFSGNTQAAAAPLLSNHAIEGSVKLAQNVLFPKQNGREQKGVLPKWYAALREEVEMRRSSDGVVGGAAAVSEDSAIRSVSSLGQVYGLSIMGPASSGTTSDSSVVDASDEIEGKSESSKDVLGTEESLNIEAAFAGCWGPETTLDPEVVDTCLLLTKLKAMQVPPLPPQLGGTGGGQITAPRRLTPVSRDGSTPTIKNWKPKMNAMMATSSSVSGGGHTAPVMRLAVSVDQRFFVSGSHDGTCRVWEIPQIEDSPGILESCTSYRVSEEGRATRVNDIAMLEGSHSIVSGASDGSVHVWRVDMVASAAPATTAANKNAPVRSDSPRVVGTSAIRKAHPNEGEVLAVSHFNSPSASVVTYATQKGTVHSWDLRCAQEPFALRHSASLGNLTAMALGGDRNWLVSGTSSGHITLWDIRYQQPVKLWRHSRGASISRLATSYILSPQHWGTNDPSRGARPFIFAAAGSNECGMFDVLSGNCQGCFRAMEGDSRNLNGHVVAPPTLEPVRIAPRQEGNMVKSSQPVISTSGFPSSNAINCMVGSVGTGDQSYLITGGGDSMIRYWDFSLPSKCFVVSGQSTGVHPRPSYERVDFENNGRLLLCRESSMSLGLRDTNASVPRKLFRGLKKPEHFHSDSVEDLKVIDNSCLISCSRDCTVKVWR